MFESKVTLFQDTCFTIQVMSACVLLTIVAVANSDFSQNKVHTQNWNVRFFKDLSDF